MKTYHVPFIALSLAATSAHAETSALEPTAIAIPQGPSRPDKATLATVDEGDVVYEVDIEAPWSPKGPLPPRVRLQYHSGHTGDGTMGLGWSIPLPKMQRDTTYGLTTEETPWTLQGMGLGAPWVPTGGTWYRPETDDIPLRIDASTWTVYDEDGIAYVYGHPVEGDGHIGERLLTEIRDTHGQTVTIEYDTQDHLPLTIRKYGHTLRYEWTEGPPHTRNDHGVLLTHTKRLHAITVLYQDTVLWTYTLTYQGDRLVRVQQITPDQKAPATTFEYGDEVPATIKTLPSIIGPYDALIDVDQDSLPDILHAEPGNWQWQRNLGDLEYAPWTPYEDHTWTLQGNTRYADIDKDGALELWVWPDQGEPYIVDHGPLPAMPPSVDLVDVDKDGRVDAYDRALGLVYTWTHDLQATPVPNPPPPTAHLWCDVNGDGLADAYTYEDGLLYVYYAEGRGRHTSAVLLPQAKPPHACTDITGDRRAEWVHVQGKNPEDQIYYKDLDGDAHPEQVWVTPTETIITRTQAPQTHKLTAVEHQGVRQEITYQAAHTLASTPRPIGASLAHTLTVKDAYGVPETVTYRYGDALHNPTHGPYGWSYVEETHHATPHVQETVLTTYYEDQWAYRGLSYATTVADTSTNTTYETTSHGLRRPVYEASLHAHVLEEKYTTYNDDGYPIHVDHEGLRETYTYTPHTPKGPLGRVTAHVRTLSEHTRRTSYAYDAHGDITTITEGDTPVLYQEYDEGLLAYVEDGEGTYVLITHDDEGYPIQEDHHGLLTYEAEYNPALGTLTRLTPPNLVTLTYTYDSLRRPLTIHRNHTPYQEYSYDDHPTCTITTAQTPLSETITAQTPRRTLYITTKHPDGYAVQEHNSYERGLTTTTHLPAYTTKPLDCTPPPNLTVDHEAHYDALLRPTHVQTPSALTTHHYDGRTHTATTHTLQTTTTYDAHQNIVTRDQYRYTHGPDGNVLTAADPEGHTRVYTYGEDGTLTTVHDRDSGTVRYTYDGRLQVTTRQDPDITVQTTYDALGRIETHGPYRYTYTPQNQVESIQDPTSTITFTYDEEGRLASKHRDLLPHPVLYTYDADDNIASLSYHRYTAHLRWGPHNTLLEVAPYISDITYTPSYTWQSLTLYDDTPVTRTFDAEGYETERSTPEWYLRTSYDPLHNTLSKTTPEHAEAFSYTPKNLIASYTHNGSTSHYTYRPDKTLATINQTPVSVEGSHRSSELSYTPGGRVTSHGISYDDLGRIQSVQGYAYAYDPDHHAYLTTTEDHQVISVPPIETVDDRTLFYVPGPLTLIQPL